MCVGTPEPDTRNPVPETLFTAEVILIKMKFYDIPRHFKKRTAVITGGGETLTYDQLADRSDALVERLPERRLVLILCKNNVETLVGYLAAMRSNNAVLLLDAGIDRDLLGHLVEVYRPGWIWRPVEGPGKPDFFSGDYGLYTGERGPAPDLHPDLKLLLSTSGSTGSPKLVRLSEKNLDANARSIATYLELGEHERAVTSLPFSYTYGLSVVNSHLRVGACLLLTDASIVQRQFWDFFKRESATSFAGVPYMYEVLKRLNIFRMSLPSLRYLTQAGGRLDPELAREFVEKFAVKGVPFYIMYGQTEATARIAYLPPEVSRKKFASIGNAIPGGTLSLEDEQGREIGRSNVEGELVYRGPNVMMGYAACLEDLSRGDEMHGVLKTGDIARRDEDGYYFITGRKKRFLKVFGKRVNLREVENHLEEQGISCVCGGKDDLLCVALVGGNAKQQGLKNRLSEKYGFHHSSVKVKCVENVPRNPSGKILYNELFREELERG